MKRDLGLYLDDILECIERIQAYTKGVTEEEFYQTVLLEDAAIRRLEIIGGAARHLPQRSRDKHPNVPWQDIVGMRNRLVHEYFGIQLRRAWKVVKEDLTDLKDTILKIKEDLPQP